MLGLDLKTTGASLRLYFLVVLLFGAGILFSLYVGGRLVGPVPTFASDNAIPGRSLARC